MTISPDKDKAKVAGVGQLVLFHYDPSYDDEMIAANEAHAQHLFLKVLLLVRA